MALEGLLAARSPPTNYNRAWWELARKYQGVAPPLARSEADFDPGAKYHVAGERAVHPLLPGRASCSSSSTARSARRPAYKGPLHRCSIYGSKAAGEKLWSTLEMGRSRPWPDALDAMTGQRQMDASAILDYFAPLMKWLDEQNEGRTCGWK